LLKVVSTMRVYGLRKYGLGAASMLVLVLAILLVSGWGSAVAAQVSGVFVTNTPANPVPVSGAVTVSNLPATQPVSGAVTVSNLPQTQPVSGTVDVGNFPGNFPAAPSTVVITSGVIDVPNAGFAHIIPQTDLSAYREVTLYLIISPGAGLGQSFDVETFDPNGIFYGLDGISTGTDTEEIKTYDPAPPNIKVGDHNQSGFDVQINWMLVGRTG
jgi:hypothetical protein